MKTTKRVLQTRSGFTLPELMISVFILMFVFAGIIISFFHCMYLNEMSRNSGKAVTAVKTRISDIENTAFDQIVSTYNNTTFTDPDINGIGTTSIDDSNPNALVLTLSFSWQQGNGRIIGEDLNLNGQLDYGEDINGNGELDSPVKITTSIYKLQG